jgi:hypothetical protein
MSVHGPQPKWTHSQPNVCFLGIAEKYDQKLPSSAHADALAELMLLPTLLPWQQGALHPAAPLLQPGERHWC